MKKIELEVFTTAFDIKMTDDDLVIIYSTDEGKDGDIYRVVAWWDNEKKYVW